MHPVAELSHLFPKIANIIEKNRSMNELNNHTYQMGKIPAQEKHIGTTNYPIKYKLAVPQLQKLEFKESDETK
jgi:hypothetical protein